MTREQVRQFSELGYNAAHRVAERTNADNANEFAATSVARELDRGILNGNLPKAVLTTQLRCGLDLSALLAVDENEQHEAIAAFIGGCMRFLAENPD